MSELFTEATLEIPGYQRDYRWGQSEAGDLWNDLIEYAEPDRDGTRRPLFLGTVIFEGKSDASKLLVVDGQQRLTTIQLLLLACRAQAKRLNNLNQAARIQAFISHTDQVSGNLSGFVLKTSPSVRACFEYVASEGWDEIWPEKLPTRAGQYKQVKRQANRLRPIYSYFDDQLRSFSQERLDKLLRALYDAYVVKIVIQDSFEAFSIFERTNARGVDLEAADLLKNFLYSQQVPDIEESWDLITQKADGSVLRMIKYFYTSRCGYVKKSELYKEIKNYASCTSAQDLTDQMVEFSDFYAAVRSASSSAIKSYLEARAMDALASRQESLDSFASSLEALKFFKVTQVYPVIYSALNCCNRTVSSGNLSNFESFLRLLGNIESYHFINNAVCNRVGNEVERFFADYCVRFGNSDDFMSVAASFQSDLLGRIASREEFSSRFVGDISYKTDASLISYIFDRFNNFGRLPGSVTRIFTLEPGINRKNHNIEHIYPQNPESMPVLDGDALHSIGNLFPVCWRTNIDLGNATPAEKVARLEGDLEAAVENKIYIRDFIRNYGDEIASWGEEAIAKRAADLSADAYDRVWSLRPLGLMGGLRAQGGESR